MNANEYLECPECKSENIRFAYVEIEDGDEGYSQAERWCCEDCGNRWLENEEEHPWPFYSSLPDGRDEKPFKASKTILDPNSNVDDIPF